MDVILLERIPRLGQMGDVVRVRDGYARNFLLPQGKALRANEDNRKRFEAEKVHLEARNLDRRNEAEVVAAKIAGQTFIVIRQAGETGQLYGSVSARDLIEIIEAGGFTVARSQIALKQPIKTIGMHEVTIALHADVNAPVIINVARSEDEAVRQVKGEDLAIRPEAGEDDEAAPSQAPTSNADEPEEA
jgi:large subunit ribosomal protein L9